jgi:hypothetical protein
MFNIIDGIVLLPAHFLLPSWVLFYVFNSPRWLLRVVNSLCIFYVAIISYAIITMCIVLPSFCCYAGFCLLLGVLMFGSSADAETRMGRIVFVCGLVASALLIAVLFFLLN